MMYMTPKWMVNGIVQVGTDKTFGDWPKFWKVRGKSKDIQRIFHCFTCRIAKYGDTQLFSTQFSPTLNVPLIKAGLAP